MIIKYILTVSALLLGGQLNNDTLFKQTDKTQNVSVSSIFTDSNNIIWAGTESGVITIDLKKKINTTIERVSGGVYSLMEEKATGNIWLVTRTYTMNNHSRNESEALNEVKSLVTKVVDMGKEIWIATKENGIIRYDKHTSEEEVFNKRNTKLPSNSINDIFVDRDNRIWVATDNGVCVKYAHKWKVVKKKVKANAIKSIDNRIWVSGIRQLWEIKDDRVMKTIQTDTLIQTKNISDFEFDKNGNIWVITNKVSVNRDNKWHHFGKNDGFTSIQPTCITIDKYNTVWVGTAGRGIFYYKQEVEREGEDIQTNTQQLLKYDPYNLKLDNRPIVKQEINQHILKSTSFKIFVFDYNEYDRDSVNIYLNEKPILTNHLLTKEGYTFNVNVNPDSTNYIILHAINQGSKPPNTAAIRIKEKDEEGQPTEKRYNLRSDLTSCGAIQLKYRPIEIDED